MKGPTDYKLILEMIDTYLPSGFEGMETSDPLLQKINAFMLKNKQFFYIADMIDLKILYTNPTVKEVLGIKPEEFSPLKQFEIMHPDDMQRFAIARSKSIELSGDLYSTHAEDTIISSNFRFRHANGHFLNCIVQGYAFYDDIKLRTYAIFIKTDISWFGPIKHGYHYYIGRDLSCFRLPDEALIQTGCIFTDREFEIIKLIKEGLHSDQIGEKLYISPHTVDTHRRNILKKTNKSTTAELIIDLQEKGFF